MLASSGSLHSHWSTTGTVISRLVHPKSGCLQPQFKCRESNHASSPCATPAARKKASPASVGVPARQQPTMQKLQTVQELNSSADESVVNSAGHPAGADFKEDEAGIYWEPVAKRWMARLEERTDSGVSYKRLSFSASLHGFELAKQMAIAARQASLQRAQPKQAGMPGTAVHQSHVRGVSFDGTPGRQRWLSSWQGPEGKLVKKCFSVKRFGLEEAKRMAEQARLDAEKSGEAQNIKRKAMPDGLADLV